MRDIIEFPGVTPYKNARDAHVHFPRSCTRTFLIPSGAAHPAEAHPTPTGDTTSEPPGNITSIGMARRKARQIRKRHGRI